MNIYMDNFPYILACFFFFNCSSFLLIHFSFSILCEYIVSIDGDSDKQPKNYEIVWKEEFFFKKIYDTNLLIIFYSNP